MNEPSFSHDVVADVRRLRAFDAQLTAARARFPLATARLWHRDAPRTSQRTAFTSDIGELLHAVLGGMGSGKTEGAIQVAAAMARGRNDLEVQVWARSNGFPLHRIPPAPKLIIVSAASHQLSAVTLRPLFEALMPEGTRYGFWSSKTHEAAAYLPNGCEARFMAETQPLAQFQSMSASFALLDEQHRETVVDSVLQRVTRNAWSGGHGWALLSATPAQALVDPNMAWMHQRLEVEARDGYRMTHIYGSDNPYLDRAARERLLIGMDAAQRRMEDQGSWYSPGGMVFERFDRSIHVIQPITIPDDWQRIGALDIGINAPTAYLAAAYDARNDQLHVYDGHYDRNAEPEHHARGIHELHGRHGEGPPPTILGDLQTPDAIAIAVRYADAGIRMSPADKSFGSGVAAVNDRMAPRQRGRFGFNGPGVVIHDVPGTQPLLNEIPLFSWKKGHLRMLGPTSKATQGADHACDDLRYLCYHLWLSGRAG